MQSRVVIVGTGTNVGKTHVAAALIRALVSRRRGVVVGKPVESGVTDEHASDSALLTDAAGAPQVGPLYSFAKPVSPHRAARKAGVVIDVGNIVLWVAALGGELAVIETAGGLHSPLSEIATNLELVRALEPTALILVGADRLGTLHDVRGCMLALGPLAARTVVVLSAPEQVDQSSGTNASELIGLGWTELAITFPRADQASAGTTLAARFLADGIEPWLPPPAPHDDLLPGVSRISPPPITLRTPQPS
ncbi:MAG: dethiobiotin synthase [Myxococcales bacterium]|nr:dethiobiotin synthase [Myxococcales bacterium]